MFPHAEETGTLRKKGVRLTKLGTDVEGRLYYVFLYNRLEYPRILVSLGALEPIPPRVPRDDRTRMVSLPKSHNVTVTKVFQQESKEF